MRDKRKVGHSSTLAIASSAKERDEGRIGQDVLLAVGGGRSPQSATWALGRGKEQDSAVVAVSTGVGE